MGRDQVKYAKETGVSPSRSRLEIEHTLSRYGATQFAYGWKDQSAMIGFEFSNRLIRFTVNVPNPSEVRTPKGRRPRYPTQAHEQVVKQIWRALALGIKAKLELVESGITTFEQEFLPQTVLPNGQTFGEWAEPQLDAIYTSRKMPPLLMSGNSNEE